MRRERKRGTIGLGLIGAGPVWEGRYRPIFSRLADRIAIRAVYDSVPARAQLAAGELQAEVVEGLSQLFERSDVQGVLILDPEWQGLVPAELACVHRKPAFLAGSLGDDLPAIRSLYAKSLTADVLLMTEFSRRHTPATNRLRELTATQLGAVRRITISAQLPPVDATAALPGQRMRIDVLIGLLDWCVYLTGRVPAVVVGTPLESPHAGVSRWKIQLGFRHGSSDAVNSTAEIVIADESPLNADCHATSEHSVECERGVITISHPTEIAWENGEGKKTESLTADRSEAEVMLDKFCRRLLGGVVPAADVLDVCRALALARAAEQSLHTGQPVAAPWEF